MKLVFITVFCIIALGQVNISNGFSLKCTLYQLESIFGYAHFLTCTEDDSNPYSDSNPKPTPTVAHSPSNEHLNSSAIDINSTVQQNGENTILGITESQFMILSVVTLVVLGGIGMIFLYLIIRDSRKIRAERQRRQTNLDLCKQKKAAPNGYVV